MKITTDKSTEFKPVTVSFTFETQRELDVFGSLFNYTPITDTLDKLIGIVDVPYYKHFESVGANCNNTFEVAKLIYTHAAIKKHFDNLE